MSRGRKARDLTGQQFGRLTVTERAGTYVSPYDPNGKKYVVWRCRCECGSVVDVMAHNLMHGCTRSCGCLRQETSRLNGMALRGRRYAV